MRLQISGEFFDSPHLLRIQFVLKKTVFSNDFGKQWKHHSEMEHDRLAMFSFADPAVFVLGWKNPDGAGLQLLPGRVAVVVGEPRRAPPGDHREEFPVGACLRWHGLLPIITCAVSEVA